MSISATWSTRRLDDCVELLSGGTPSKQEPAFWGGDIPWVSCKDMKVERLHTAEDCITELGAQNGTRLVPAGTVLIVVRGMILAKDFPVGRAMRELAFNQDLKAVVCKPNVGDEFLFYWFLANSHHIKGIADEAAHGTKRIQTDRLLALPVRLPPPSVQQRIAAVLSAYDDLIENNERRIRILEEMAQNLYRERFVNFRFPGHKKVKMVDSPLGRIPQGWSVGRLADLAAINNRSIGKGREPSSILYIDIASVAPGVVTQKQRMPFAEAPGRARRLVQHGDVIWSCVRPNRRSFALLLDPEPDLVVSTGFAVITAMKVPFSYLYFALTTDDFVGYLTNHATGAAYPAVTAKDFEAANVLVPAAQQVDAFHDAVCPMLELRYQLTGRNRILRQTRDLLLPRLISGELDVSDLDIKVPED